MIICTFGSIAIKCEAIFQCWSNMQLTKNTLQNLLTKTIQILNSVPNRELRTKQGTEFEGVLKEYLDKAVNLLGFTNVRSIELVSGHRYPDIVIHTVDSKLGIEVKTSKSKGWTTLGGSIFESTRVQGVENIMLFFANFNDLNDIQFRFAWMEDCVSDVVITHKPRYAIDMDVDTTFFEYSGVEYKKLQTSDKPFSLIRDYLKNRNGQKADLWWVADGEDDDLSKIGPQSIKPLSSLSKVDKDRLIAEICIIFPEIISTNGDKYDGPSLFLSTKKGIVHHSLRDLFSAGGRLEFNNTDIPKYFKHIIDQRSLKQIFELIESIPSEYLEEYWDDYNPNERHIEQWQRKIFSFTKTHPDKKLTNEIKSNIIENIKLTYILEHV